MTVMIDDRIVRVFSKASNYPVINRVGIFGSYAKGEQTQNSDIDILYDYCYDDKDTSFVLGILEFIEETENSIKKQFGSNIVTDYVSLNGLMESSNNNVKNHILNDVIWIYNKEDDTE